jgi:hypothetical protein
MKFEQFKAASAVEEGVIQRDKNVEIILKTIEFFDRKNKGNELNSKEYRKN